jgi:hypothetical protein
MREFCVGFVYTLSYPSMDRYGGWCQSGVLCNGVLYKVIYGRWNDKMVGGGMCVVGSPILPQFPNSSTNEGYIRTPTQRRTKKLIRVVRVFYYIYLNKN